MSPANDNTTGPQAANDNGPRVEMAPDLDEMAFDQALASYERMMGDIDRKVPLNRPYGMPADKAPERGYCYFRCGLRGKAHAESQAQVLRGYGWAVAPKGTRFYGYEVDGENGLYMYTRLDVYQAMHERKNLARRLRELNAVRSAENLATSITDDDRLRKAGVRAEVTSVETGRATFDEIAESQRRGRAARK